MSVFVVFLAVFTCAMCCNLSWLLRHILIAVFMSCCDWILRSAHIHVVTLELEQHYDLWFELKYKCQMRISFFVLLFRGRYCFYQLTTYF